MTAFSQMPDNAVVKQLDPRTGVRRSSATIPPWDPTVALCLGHYGDPRGWGSSYERGTPVIKCCVGQGKSCLALIGTRASPESPSLPTSLSLPPSLTPYISLCLPPSPSLPPSLFLALPPSLPRAPSMSLPLAPSLSLPPSLPIWEARVPRGTRRRCRKPFDSSTGRVTYPESYITKYTTYTEMNAVLCDQFT